MSTPAVRIAPGTGIALRTAGIIAWFDPAPHEHPTLLVRNLIAAARDSGGLPQSHLADLAHNTPGLSLAVVALGSEFGQAWVCGDAHITIDGVAERRVIAALGPSPQHAYFPLPRFAVRMGDATAPTAWSHLIEGAVPASGISVVWDPSEHSTSMAPRSARLMGRSVMNRGPNRPGAVPAYSSSTVAPPSPSTPTMCSAAHRTWGRGWTGFGYAK